MLIGRDPDQTLYHVDNNIAYGLSPNWYDGAVQLSESLANNANA